MKDKETMDFLNILFKEAESVRVYFKDGTHKDYVFENQTKEDEYTACRSNCQIICQSLEMDSDNQIITEV